MCREMKFMHSSVGVIAWLTLAMLFCCNDLASGDSIYVQDLKGLSWSLSNHTDASKLLTATKIKLPFGVYSDLYKEDVLNSFNDVNLRWISYSNWTYTLVFAEDIKNSRKVNLTFYGIDTVAEIRLNHIVLGRTDNMFVRYSYEVGRILRDQNVLEVEITSPVHAALSRANELLARNINVPPECPPERYHGECHMNMLRKMQASFAWDWGLAAPSMGIWKTVALEFYEVALIRDVDVAISRNDTHWNMHIRVFIDAGGAQDFYAELKFYAIELLDETIVISDYVLTPLNHRNPVISFDQAFPLEKVILWWPNGYGDPQLYPLHFTLKAWLHKEGPSPRARTTSQKSVRVGFRTIELVEQAVPEGEGNTFFFRVNGVDIFMKGTNYIPLHILPELGNDETRIRHLMQSVRDGHMNMLRVWGGGIYESDFFYEMADYYGILIWQDMMFACAMYPATEEFLASVRVEVAQNAKRIAYHPSIAIFATNNENEAALAQNWYGTDGPEQSRFESDYRELYIANVLHELKIIQHSSRPTPLVSSPSNGKESAKDNYISKNPQDPHYGDIHFYPTFEDGWDASIYKTPRFASEYGFQSLPQMQSWLNSKKSEDDLLKLIDHRQHHPAAMELIIALVRRHLPLPLPDAENYAEALIYMSQIAQAMATKIETEWYRSLRDTEHRTMGALYWQLNDVWVAPSWSSIDFYGNYKLLHHWARSFMAPISIVSLYDTKTQSVNVTLICDKLTVDNKQLEVTMNIYLWSELYPKKQITWPVTLKPNGVHYDKVIPISTIFEGIFTKTNSFVEFVLHDSTGAISRNYYFPTKISAAQGVEDPIITVEIPFTYCYKVDKTYMNIISLNVSVRKPAIFLYIEITNSKVVQYKLSRNGFMMLVPTQMVHLEFESSKCVDIKRNDIKVLTVNQFMP